MVKRISAATVAAVVAVLLGGIHSCQGRVQFDPFGRLKVTQ